MVCGWKKYLPSQPEQHAERQSVRGRWSSQERCGTGARATHLSVIPSWHQSVCQRWAVRICTLWTRASRLMGSTILTHYWWGNFCRISGSHCRITSRFSRTAHQGAWNSQLAKARDMHLIIPPDLWPPNSADLKPVDNKIWGIIQDRVHARKITSVDELEQRISNAGQDWSAADWQCHNTVA